MSNEAQTFPTEFKTVCLYGSHPYTAVEIMVPVQYTLNERNGRILLESEMDNYVRVEGERKGKMVVVRSKVMDLLKRRKAEGTVPRGLKAGDTFEVLVPARLIQVWKEDADEYGAPTEDVFPWDHIQDRAHFDRVVADPEMVVMVSYGDGLHFRPF